MVACVSSSGSGVLSSHVVSRLICCCVRTRKGTTSKTTRDPRCCFAYSMFFNHAWLHVFHTHQGATSSALPWTILPLRHHDSLRLAPSVVAAARLNMQYIVACSLHRSYCRPADPLVAYYCQPSINP